MRDKSIPITIPLPDSLPAYQRTRAALTSSPSVGASGGVVDGSGVFGGAIGGVPAGVGGGTASAYQLPETVTSLPTASTVTVISTPSLPSS